MRFVRVQFDADNREFKLADDELSSEIEDCGMYLIADLSPTDFLPAEDMDLLDSTHSMA